MIIQPLSGASVALFLTKEDLTLHGISAKDITLEQALAIARSAFDEAGLTVDGEVELEAYPDDGGVLLFAHIKRKKAIHISFSGFEEVLEAVAALHLPCPHAALFFFEGRYWLSLPGTAEQAGRALSEYGRTERSSVYLEGHLAEYGSLILPEDAIGALRRFLSLIP